ncbi:MAG: ribonuclease III [Lachnospiraceae bacterium]|nr:ribonuclease III [Lachnospiraceae bacterium]
MEESIRNAFELNAVPVNTVPVLSLAYLGDAVCALIVRTVLLEKAKGENGAVHQRTLPYVSAVGQAKMADSLLPELSEEELAVYRRGKNAKPEHGAKNASSLEYHKATGLEALIGSLYLEGKMERILELIRKGMSYAGED